MQHLSGLVRTVGLAAGVAGLVTGCQAERVTETAETAGDQVLVIDDYSDQMYMAFRESEVTKVPYPEGASFTLCWDSVDIRNSAMMEAFDRAWAISTNEDPPPAPGEFQLPSSAHQWSPRVSVAPADGNTEGVADAGGDPDRCFVVRYGRSTLIAHTPAPVLPAQPGG